MTDPTDMRGLFSDARAEAESAPEHSQPESPRLHPPDVFNEGERKTDPPSAEFHERLVESGRPVAGMSGATEFTLTAEGRRVLGLDEVHPLDNAYRAAGERQSYVNALARAEVEPWRVAVDMMLLRSEP